MQRLATLAVLSDGEGVGREAPGNDLLPARCLPGFVVRPSGPVPHEPPSPRRHVAKPVAVDRDQPSRVVALVDIQTGEVLQTVLTWERVEGSIVVYYGHAANIPVPVPIRMAEQFVTQSGARVGGEATYTNFRQFQTSARIVR